LGLPINPRMKPPFRGRQGTNTEMGISEVDFEEEISVLSSILHTMIFPKKFPYVRSKSVPFFVREYPIAPGGGRDGCENRKQREERPVNGRAL